VLASPEQDSKARQLAQRLREHHAANHLRGVGVQVILDAASIDLLQRAREFVVGCGQNNDESCECATCAAATEILDLIDAHLQRACKA
jgi:hypothetical protein